MFLSGCLWGKVQLSWCAKSAGTHPYVFRIFVPILLFSLSFRIYSFKKNPYVVILEGFQEGSK